MPPPKFQVRVPPGQTNSAGRSARATPFLSACRILSVAFPLTALSLGEREKRRQSVDESSGAGVVESRPCLLPLPQGEGQGEGKRAAASD
jgi:hypothetical protein